MHTLYCICVHVHLLGEHLHTTDLTNVAVYYLGGYGAWDGRNCRVLRETDEEVECGCDHLTHFAILLVSAKASLPKICSFHQQSVSHSLPFCTNIHIEAIIYPFEFYFPSAGRDRTKFWFPS